jgi:hypothetical protein
MAWEKEWTIPKHEITNELIEILYKTLDNLIKSNGGMWRGTIQKVIEHSRLGNSDEWYSTVFAALPKVKEKYGIKSKTAGPAGNSYFYENNVESENGLNLGSIEKLEQTKTLLNTLGNKTLNEKEAQNIIQIIKKVID